MTVKAMADRFALSETGVVHMVLSRLASLYAEKAAIEYRIQETEAGRMVSIDEDRAAERAREIIAQADQLLGDFDRVRDQFEVIHLDLRKRLLQYEGSRRELVEQLLDGIDIIRETDAGFAATEVQ